MLNLITEIVVDFGISSVFSNVGTTLITKSKSNIVNKIGIGIGAALIAGVTKDITKKYIDNKIDEFKEMLNNSEKEVKEDGGEVSE